MRRIAFVLVAVVALAGVVAYMAPASGPADGEAAPISGVKTPPGYREWRLISVAHEEGDLNDLRAILGNDVAIKLPFPGGLDRYVVAQNGAQIVEVAFFVGHGDQPPLAISGGGFHSGDRSGLSVGWSRCGGHVGDHAGQRYNCNQHESNPSHTVPPQTCAI